MGEVQKLKGKEKFAYGIGAVGKDMVYMLSPPALQAGGQGFESPHLQSELRFRTAP